MGYSAGPGYDLATGFGSVSAPGLRTALAALPARTLTLVLRAIPQSIYLSSPEVGIQFTVLLDALSSSSTLQPTGTVIFKIDGVAQAAPATFYNGLATAYMNLNSLGAHTISATYGGDTNFNAASTTITVSAVQATPQISQTILGYGATLNSPVSMQADVTVGTVTPTGTLTFVVDGATASPPLTLVLGVGGFTYPGFKTPGRHTVVATYSGDPLVTAGSSLVSNVVINVPTQVQTPRVTLSATPQPLSVGAPATITAAVAGTGASGTAKPTGFVTFTIDSVALPTVAVDATGQASVVYTYTAAESSIVTASYSGDSVFFPSDGSSFFSVAGPPPPTIALALSTASVNIPSTGTASVGLTTSSINGFNGPVSFAVAIVSATGAPFSGCYAVSPGVAFPSPGTPWASTLSMALASNSLCAKAAAVRSGGNASSAGRPMPTRTPWAAVFAAGVLGCALFRTRSPRGLLALLVLAFALGAAGCGGSGGSSTTTTTTPTTPPATPSPTAGTYVVRVTATAQTTGVSASGTFTLTTQ